MRSSFPPSASLALSRRRSQGFTLIEVAIAAILVAMLTSGVLLFIADQMRTSEAQAEGLALNTINSAVGAYEAKYSANLENKTAIPISGYGNVANEYSPTLVELTEMGFLKTSQPTGIYGISINTTVTQGTPSGMVWIVKPFTDTLGRPSQELASAAMIAAGGDAAFSTTANPAIVTGVDGWYATNPVGSSAAVVAMRNGAGSAAYVRLDGSTPMEGSLNMNGYNLTSANNVSANSATVSGATTTGSLTSSGNVSAGGNVSASGSVSGTTLTATAQGNDVLFGTSALYSDGWNTVIRNAGGALYVQNFSGALEPTVTSQVVTSAGNGVQVGSTYFYGDSTNSAVRQNGTLYIQNQAGTAAANVNLAYLQVNGTATAGAGCSSNGMMAQNGAGSPLFCVNGVWQSISSKPTIVTRVGGQSNTLSTASCASNEVMTGGICSNLDECNGNDSSAFGGYPSGNTLYCPRTSAAVGCDLLTAYVFCAQ